MSSAFPDRLYGRQRQPTPATSTSFPPTKLVSSASAAPFSSSPSAFPYRPYGRQRQRTLHFRIVTMTADANTANADSNARHICTSHHPVHRDRFLRIRSSLLLRFELPTTPEREPVEFPSTLVQLASPEDPQATRRLFYLIRDDVLVAVLSLLAAN
ncbi:hypothetical protein B0H11DRAFT_1908084 [Mycena galericulata]|nr:hypothetical protein B0H11DRAFT_1908084 [Mycena galericulata]